MHMVELNDDTSDKLHNRVSEVAERQEWEEECILPSTYTWLTSKEDNVLTKYIWSDLGEEFEWFIEINTKPLVKFTFSIVWHCFIYMKKIQKKHKYTDTENKTLTYTQQVL